MSEVAAEFRFGLRDLVTHRLGGVLAWEGKGVRTPRMSPVDGDFDGDAYAVCPDAVATSGSSSRPEATDCTPLRSTLLARATSTPTEGGRRVSRRAG